MHLHNLEISNFRSIEKLSFSFSDGVNLIVGPNAVGKTTVLEAVRLAKALLAPRTSQESRNALVSLSVISNSLPQIFNFGAIARDENAPVRIACKFKLDDEEVEKLPGLSTALAQNITAAQHGIPMQDAGQLSLVQFLSTPEGMRAYQAVQAEVANGIGRVAQTKACNLILTIDRKRGGVAGEDGFSQILFQALEAQRSPYKTLFSYFPADRALPAGDIPIQLGAIDAAQQLESHNSLPANKYQRLKTSIYASVVAGSGEDKVMKKTFKDLFSHLLEGREITDESFGVNEYGQAVIRIKDTVSGRFFDIDSMSSGEKGLILTFLLIAQTVDRGGLILLDEPELHLNPAVSKRLLGFLQDDLLRGNRIQAIICTHSPEIFGTAMRRDDSIAFHLRSGSSVAEVRKRDQSEVQQALRLLGTSEVEELLYQAVVFVEGEDDVDLLEDAFPELLSKIKFRELSGRAEIEKHIQRLQEAERKGEKENITYFLFDHDRRPTTLTSTAKVRIKQWDRYCLENYLLEPSIIFDTLRGDGRDSRVPDNLGDAQRFFIRLALKQLRPLIIEQVYNSYGFTSPGIRQKDKAADDFTTAADVLFTRIEELQSQVCKLQSSDWKGKFVAACEASLREREAEWEVNWQAECSGKQFFKDLFKECRVGMRTLPFKRSLLRDNKLNNTENWKLLRENLEELVSL